MNSKIVIAILSGLTIGMSSKGFCADDFVEQTTLQAPFPPFPMVFESIAGQWSIQCKMGGVTLTLHTGEHSIQSILGNWSAELSWGAFAVFLIFHITNKDGVMHATVDCPEHKLFGHAVVKVTVYENSLSFEIADFIGPFKKLFGFEGKEYGDLSAASEAVRFPSFGEGRLQMVRQD